MFEDSSGFHAVDLASLVEGNDFFAPVSSGQSTGTSDIGAWHENVEGPQTQALDQWKGAVGDASVLAAVAADPIGVSDVIAGTTVWNNVVGVDAVNGVMRADPIGTLDVVRGTSIAVQYFGQEAVEEVIRLSPDVAVQAARALEFAEKAGYSELEVKAFITANPTNWYNYQP